MIDLTKVPCHRIHLSQCLHAYEIVRFCKKQGIKSLVYSFAHNSNIMKYGVQYDSINQQEGERVYRQAFHIPGWPKVASPNSAGNDMLDIIKFFPGIHKNNVEVNIWDMTQYPRASIFQPKFEINSLERQLIKDYVDLHGFKPLGNIKDESHMDSKTVLSDKHFETLFDYE